MAVNLNHSENYVLTEDDKLDPDVSLTVIRLDGGTQSRAAMDDAAIAEYSEAIKQGATLPPLVVFFDGVDFWLADGFHRYHAYRAAGVDWVEALVRTGSRRDAVLYSVGANAAHGLRRTNADKKRAVETLLADAEWAVWSDREIARQCGVSHPFVAAIRSPAAAIRQQENRDSSVAQKITVVESDSTDTPAAPSGATYEQNTANIGNVKTSTVARPVTEIVAAFPATEALKPVRVVADLTKDATTPDELAILRAENTELREELAALKTSFAETLNENEVMGRVFDADDMLKAATDEVKRQTAIAASAESRMHAKMGECAEAIRLVKYWKSRAEKAEKLNQAAA